MPRNFRVYRGDGEPGRLSDTLAVGTENDDGTVTAQLVITGHTFGSIAEARAACESMSPRGAAVVYDDEEA